MRHPEDRRCGGLFSRRAIKPGDSLWLLGRFPKIDASGIAETPTQGVFDSFLLMPAQRKLIGAIGCFAYVIWISKLNCRAELEGSLRFR